MTITQRLYAVGFMLFLWYACLVVVPQVGLLLGFEIGAWQFWVCLPILVACSWMFHRNYFGINHPRDLFINLVVCLLLFLLCLILAAGIYSTHYNNNHFHLEAIYGLLGGWNPNYHPGFVGPDPYLSEYLTQTPVSMWVYGSVVSAFTGIAETGKAACLHLMLCNLLIAQHLGRAVFKLSTVLSWFLAILIFLNPIAILDIYSFSPDGIIAQLFFLGISFALYQIQEGGWLKGFFALLVFSILVNTSRYAILPGVLTVFCFLVFLQLSGAYKWQKILFIGVGWFILSFFVFGFNVHLKPFFEEPTYQVTCFSPPPKNFPETPAIYHPSFSEKSKLKKIFLSFYAIPILQEDTSEIRWKTLFSPVSSEAYINGNTDIAGLGPFAPEVITFLLPLGLFVLFKRGNSYKKWGLVIVGLIFFSLLISPHPWVFRLIPQIWMLVIFMLLLLFREAQWKAMALVLGMGLILNSVLLFHTYYVHSKLLSEQLITQYQTIAKGQKDFKIDPSKSFVFKMRAKQLGMDTSSFDNLGSDTAYFNFIGDKFAKYKKRMADNE